MTFPVQILVEAEDTISDLEALQSKFENLDEFVLMVGELWSSQMEFNFSSNDWPPLAAATIARKQAEGYPLDILVRTKAMKDQAVGGEWSASQMGNTATAVLGLTDYSRFHIDGPTRWMPQRDFTFLPDKFGEQVEIIFYEYLDA